jgi:outer membrane protein TolC
MKFFKLGHLPTLQAVTVIFVLFNSVILGFNVSAHENSNISANISANKELDNYRPLTLPQAISIAIEVDPWLTRSELRQKAMIDISEAVDSLPNPIISIGLANIPTNGFAFDQEPMTQLKAGVTQQFPRGQSLEIQQQQLQELAQQHPLLRQDRMAKTKVVVSSLWLELYRAQQIIALIENDRVLFQQLAEIIQASYASAVGSVRQQDIVRAQLELTRLDDRLNTLMSQKEQAGGQLVEWLSNGNDWQLSSSDFTRYKRVSPELPFINSLEPNVMSLLTANDKQNLAQKLNTHPAILAIEQRIEAGETSVELAKQLYKSQWGVNASYAYRADDPSGRSRADFFSIGVSFDLPLFTQSSQDKKVSAAVREAEAIKTDKLLALRGLIAQLQSTWSRYQHLLKRQQIFDDSILVQTREQAEASLTAYENDAGDFSEVVRARIDDLNVRIDVLNIHVDLLKAQVELNYFFPTEQSTVTGHFGLNNQRNQRNQVSTPTAAVKVGE